MFTGIVDHCGFIAEIEHHPQAIKLKIKHQFSNLDLGESIAVNGICLTVTADANSFFYCDLSPETLSVTTAKHFKVGNTVNLERALQPISRMGGHFVMGHIDVTGTVKAIQEVGEFTEIVFNSSIEYLFHKGSITVNGVSLTVNRVGDDDFAVMLIPHTLERTSLSTLEVGDEVNLELDKMARIIVEQSKRYKNS
jgi:riboflavin synthase